MSAYHRFLVTQQQAADLIRQGQLVAFGTETVYGLGADASNARAVAAIYDKKQRPQFNPLIIHLSDQSQAFHHIIPNACALMLAEQFWPGPLTLVGLRHPDSGVASLCSAGQDSLAVRVPAKAQDFLRACAVPVAAPSANRSGRLSPTQAAHVYDSFGQGSCPAILDLGACEAGLESTIIDVRTDKPRLLRAGAIAIEEIEALLGFALPHHLSSDNPSAPGQLSAHYAPSVPLRLDALTPRTDETWIAFGDCEQKAGVKAAFNLSPEADLVQAAARLFDMLHQAQALGKAIAIAPVPRQGLGLAINDRLTRAAHQNS